MDMGEFAQPAFLIVVDVVYGLVYSFVCTLTASISLRVVRDRHLQFYSRELVECCPEFSSEEGIPIRDEV
jgi:hypothetical protein